TTPSAQDTELIVEQMRRQRADAHIVVRAETLSQLTRLYEQGIHEVVQPEFEAGLELVRQALLHFDMPAAEIQRLTDSVRAERYQPLYNLHTDAQVLARLRSARQQIEVQWVEVPARSPLLGQAIGALAIRQRTGANIVAVLRGEEVLANPTPEIVLLERDCLGVLGTAEQRAALDDLIHGSETGAAPPLALLPA
ncbi:MAG TPA: TrkA C-terminal domain-containing protein, partial [Herpetosiphonaceae bacterium]